MPVAVGKEPHARAAHIVRAARTFARTWCVPSARSRLSGGLESELTLLSRRDAYWPPYFREGRFVVRAWRPGVVAGVSLVLVFSATPGLARPGEPAVVSGPVSFADGFPGRST